MNTDTWINIIGFIVLPILGFVIAWLISIQTGLNDHKLFVASNYPNKEDFKEEVAKIEKILERIFEKLDNLAVNK